MLGQDVRARADPWGHILELDPHQQGESSDMKNALIPLSKDDDLVPSPFHELAAPALPADRLLPGGILLTQQPIGGREGEHQAGEYHMHAYRPRGFLGRMFQVSLLLGFLDTAVLNEAAVIIVIKGLQGLLHRGLGQKDRCAPWPMIAIVPLADYNRVDEVGLKVSPVGMPPVIRRAILGIGGQPGEAHHFCLQPFAPGGRP
jgi:hypothetical protein